MIKQMIWVCAAVLVLTIQGAYGAELSNRGNRLFWGVALDGYPIGAEKLSRVERETGIAPQIVLFYLQWPASAAHTDFPLESLDSIRSYGAIPCISWEPMTYHGKTEAMIDYREILAGRYDRYIEGFADAARRWQEPFIIRFAHEMNTARYHWGTNPEAFGSKSPEIYRRMFRYVVDVFRRKGAHNVLWAFCPNAESVPNPTYDATAGWNRAANYYPGDRFVDLLGMDGYNWGATQSQEKNGWNSRWQSFEEVFSGLYGDLKSMAPGKPLIVFETASVGEPEQLVDWLRSAFATLGRWQVSGLVWFQVNKEVDWRIDAGKDLKSVELIRSQTSCCARDWLAALDTERKKQLRR